MWNELQISLSGKFDSAVHNGLILEVLNRVKNIVLHGKKKGFLAGELGEGAPLWIRARDSIKMRNIKQNVKTSQLTNLTFQLPHMVQLYLGLPMCGSDP